MANNHAYVPIVIFLIIVLLAFLFISGNNKAQLYNSERFYALPTDKFPVPNQANQSIASIATPNTAVAQGGVGDFGASDPSGDEVFNQVVAPVSGGPTAAPGSTCFPRDRLTATDLLPKDAANSRWAQLNPAGQGDVSDQNFLTAGYHIGINSVGSSMKNANLQLRSEPANPQVNVSPWMQSTIEPSDVGTGRRPLEIGGDY